MRVVIQRVKQAHVHCDNRLVGSITHGLCLLVAFCDQDTLLTLQKVAKKIVQLRIFEDEQGKLNQSIVDHRGEILSISQFTLYGDISKGNRPSFIKSAKAEVANPLYQTFNQILKTEYHLNIQTGCFGEHMEVSLINDGPVTIWFDSDFL